MKKIITLGTIGIATLLFTGCAKDIPYTTKIECFKIHQNKCSVRMDQHSSNYNYYVDNNIKDKNYKYALVSAARTTKDKGYSYFSMSDKELIEQYKNRDVHTINDAYNVCISGEGSFYWAASFNSLTDEKKALCEKIVSPTYNAIQGPFGHNFRKPIFLRFEMHNEDRKDNVTFNADEVLNSDLAKDVKEEYLRNNTREIQ